MIRILTGSTVITAHSHSSGQSATHGHPNQTVGLARTLIAQTLAYFGKNDARLLDMVRAHLMELIDAKPGLGVGQNLRSAHALLGRYGTRFNSALQKSLAN